MPFFETMAGDAGIADIYRAHRDQYSHWIRMGQVVMNGESALGKAERELIATYVSALNGCEYCTVSHGATMASLGIAADVVAGLVEDIDTADIPDRLRPVLEFCRKLTLEPAKIAQADADAVFAAGWDEQALHGAIAVTCRFNFMNRLAMAHGLAPLEPARAERLAEHRQKHGYAGLDQDPNLKF